MGEPPEAAEFVRKTKAERNKIRANAPVNIPAKPIVLQQVNRALIELAAEETPRPTMTGPPRNRLRKHALAGCSLMTSL